MDLTELNRLVNENSGRYVAFDNDRPNLVVFDAKKYQHLVAKEVGTGKKILVTGGLGYIGSHAVADLLDHEREVIVLDNLSAGDLSSVNCPVIVGDLLDPVLLDKIFDHYDIDAVIHFAGSIMVGESVADPNKYFLNNVSGSINLLNAMVKHGVKKIVYSSSAAVYGNPEVPKIAEDCICKPASPYGESKLTVEKILEQYATAHGLSSIAFRYFNAAGATPDRNLGETHPVETHLIPRALMVANKEEEVFEIYGSDYPTPDGTAMRDYVHVRDIARAHVLALDKLTQPGHAAYNIGTGKGYTVAQVVEKIVELTGKMIIIQKQPRRPGDAAVLVADNKKIQVELGFIPEHSELENIIKTAWTWHRNRFRLKNV